MKKYSILLLFLITILSCSKEYSTTETILFKENYVKKNKIIDIPLTGIYHNKLVNSYKEYGKPSYSKIKLYNINIETLIKTENRFSSQEIKSLIDQITNQTQFDEYIEKNFVSKEFKSNYNNFIKGLLAMPSLKKVNSYCYKFINSIPKLKLSRLESNALKCGAYVAMSTCELWYNEALNPDNVFYNSATNYTKDPMINVLNITKVETDIAGTVVGYLITRDIETAIALGSLASTFSAIF